jgi:hypothetical protein
MNSGCSLAGGRNVAGRYDFAVPDDVAWPGSYPDDIASCSQWSRSALPALLPLPLLALLPLQTR